MKRSTIDPRRTWSILILLSLVVALIRPALAQQDTDTGNWTPVSEHWYVLELNDAVIGWSNDRVDRDATDGRYRSSQQSRLKMSRGGETIEVATRTGFIESANGAPLIVRQIQDMSAMTMDTEWVFDEQGIAATIKQGNRTTRRQLEAPEGDWLTPQAAERYWREQRGAGATRISFRTLDEEEGLQPVTVTTELQRQTTFNYGGEEVAATIWHTTISKLPGVTSTQTIDDEGVLLYDEVNLPLGKMVTRRVEKAVALAAANAPAAEVMIDTFVRLERPVRDVMHMAKATMRLRVKEGAMPELPSTGAQRFEYDGPKGRATLTVDMTDPLPASGEDIDNEDFRKASALIDSDDELVRSRTERALRRAGNEPGHRAEALRKFVYQFLSEKSLSTAFASASETIRTRQGDCSEHAVLLAAMLRADGIPSRVAGGLVYVDQFMGERNVFGWHMWTQALIEDKWIDLDATLPVTYHAAHVLTSTSAMADGKGEGDLTSMLMLIGNLEIEVVEGD